MSGSVTGSTGIASGGLSNSSTSNIDSEITAMDQAFNTAIATNTEITVHKTILGAEETAAQQRPNIG